MRPRDVLLWDLTRAEALHLSVLARDFLRLLDDSPASDSALARLTPSAYPDDTTADAEFRGLTGADITAGRRADATTVIEMLGDVDGTALDAQTAQEVVPITIDRAHLPAWLRTITAIRLVLASRLGIDSDEMQETDDPRYGVYEWLAYRLDQLVETAIGPD